MLARTCMRTRTHIPSPPHHTHIPIFPPATHGHIQPPSPPPHTPTHNPRNPTHRWLAAGGGEEHASGQPGDWRGLGAHPARARCQDICGRHHDRGDAGAAATGGRRHAVRLGGARRRAQRGRRVGHRGVQPVGAGAGGAAAGHRHAGPRRHVCDQGVPVQGLHRAGVRHAPAVQARGGHQARRVPLHLGGDLRGVPGLQGPRPHRPPAPRPPRPVQGRGRARRPRRARRAAAPQAQAAPPPRGLRGGPVHAAQGAARRRLHRRAGLHGAAGPVHRHRPQGRPHNLRRRARGGLDMHFGTGCCATLGGAAATGLVPACFPVPLHTWDSIIPNPNTQATPHGRAQAWRRSCPATRAWRPGCGATR